MILESFENDQNNYHISQIIKITKGISYFVLFILSVTCKSKIM